MRRLCRWFLFLCGTALICLRLYPSGLPEWASKLFQDDAIYALANTLSLKVIQDSGLSLSLYESYADNLATLIHTAVMVLEAVAIALVFFVTARKLR
jgi:hypothetical protein